MGQAAVAVPTLREELDRKVFETIEWLFLGVQNKRITPEQFSIGIDVLFMAVSGLVGEDFIEMITAAGAESKGVVMTVRRHFHHPSEDEIRSFVWRAGESKFTMTTRIKGVATKGTVKECGSAREAVELIENVAERILAQGWVEL